MPWSHWTHSNPDLLNQLPCWFVYVMFRVTALVGVDVLVRVTGIGVAIVDGCC